MELQYLPARIWSVSAYDQAYILDLDNANNVCVFGQTLGNYPVTNGYILIRAENNSYIN